MMNRMLTRSLEYLRKNEQATTMDILHEFKGIYCDSPIEAPSWVMYLNIIFGLNK